MIYYEPMCDKETALKIFVNTIKTNKGCEDSYRQEILNAYDRHLKGKSVNSSTQAKLTVSLEWKPIYKCTRKLLYVEYEWDEVTYHHVGDWVTTVGDREVSRQGEYSELSNHKKTKDTNIQFFANQEKLYAPQFCKGKSEFISEKTQQMVASQSIKRATSAKREPPEEVARIKELADKILVWDKTLAQEYMNQRLYGGNRNGIIIRNARLTGYKSEIEMDIEWIPVYKISFRGYDSYVDAISSETTVLHYEENATVKHYEEILNKPNKSLRILIPILVLFFIFALYLYIAGGSIAFFGSGKVMIAESKSDKVWFVILNVISFALFMLFFVKSTKAFRVSDEKDNYLKKINAQNLSPEDAFAATQTERTTRSLKVFFKNIFWAIVMIMACQGFFALSRIVNFGEEFTFNNPFTEWIANLFR